MVNEGISEARASEVENRAWDLARGKGGMLLRTA